VHHSVRGDRASGRRLLATARVLRGACVLRPAALLWPAARRDALSRAGAGTRTDAECGSVPERPVRAPRRRRDDTLHVGVDPESSAASATGRTAGGSAHLR
jgi:hypothetical protein